MESLACGLPVICSNIRGNTDLVEDGISGLISDNTARGLAESIIKMIENQELRYRFSEESMKRIKHFELNKNVQLVMELYSKSSH